MASEVEYALMAGRSYQSSRATINWLPDLLAQGWMEGRYERNDSSGFEAVSLFLLPAPVPMWTGGPMRVGSSV